MRKRSLFFKNALLQFTFFISFCMMTVFTVLYMQSLGFTTLHTGIIFGLANFFSAWLQLFTGRIADSAKRITMKHVLLAHAGLAALAMVPLAFFSVHGLLVPLAFLCSAFWHRLYKDRLTRFPLPLSKPVIRFNSV